MKLTRTHSLIRSCSIVGVPRGRLWLERGRLDNDDVVHECLCH